MSLQIVGIYSDIGASKSGASKGVALMMELLKKDYKNLIEREIKIINDKKPQTNKQNHAKNIQEIYEFFKDNLIPKMKDIFLQKNLPLIFSGDHSSALGNIQAFKKAYPEKSLGIIWIDAHSDLHTPYDSSSGNIHGMPLGGVVNIVKTGENTLDSTTQIQWQNLCALGGDNAIKPQNITYIGTRSMEKSERDVIEQFKIPLYSVSDIRKDMHSSIAQILTSFEDLDALYLSVDVDVLDGKIFTSTGVRENNGLYSKELESCIELLIEGLGKRIIAFEFTEFNPALQDSNYEDSKTLFQIVSNTIERLSGIWQ